MQRLVEKILAEPKETYENWLRFERFKLVINNEEKGRDDVRTAFLFFAGIKGIAKDKISEVDPVESLSPLVLEVFDNIKKKWTLVSADFLLPIIMGLIPKLSTEELNRLYESLELICEVMHLQARGGYFNYAMITIFSSVHAKKLEIAERDPVTDESVKALNEKVTTVVKDLLMDEAAKLPSHSIRELKQHSSSAFDMKFIDIAEPVLMRSADFKEISGSALIYSACLSIYNNVIEKPSFFNLLSEVCLTHRPKLELFIKEEMLVNEALHDEYFVGRELTVACSTLAQDVLKEDSAAAEFVRKNLLLSWHIKNYQLSISLLSLVQEAPVELGAGPGFFSRKAKSIKDAVVRADVEARNIFSRVKSFQPW
jgi:hypothetical protein